MIKAILALVALGLAALLAAQWADWPPPEAPERAVVPADAGAVAPEPGPVVELRPLEDKQDFAVVVERPLFRPDRRPRNDEPDAAPEPVVEESGDLAGMDLTGVLISPRVTTAWVKDPNQPAPLRLRLGDDLQGWTVKGIQADRLVLERQGKTDELPLRAFAPPGTAPSPATVPPPPQTPAVRPPSAPTRGVAPERMPPRGLPWQGSPRPPSAPPGPVP